MYLQSQTNFGLILFEYMFLQLLQSWFSHENAFW